MRYLDIFDDGIGQARRMGRDKMDLTGAFLMFVVGVGVATVVHSYFFFKLLAVYDSCRMVH